MTFSWRDRILLANSVLFCVVGAALITRYVVNSAPVMVVILGVSFLAFGIYRLALARREIRKRAGRSN